MLNYISAALCGVIFLNTLCFGENFWEKRRKAYNNFQEERFEEQTATSFKKTSPFLFSEKEEFGIRKVKEHPSTYKFRNPYTVTVPVKYGEILKIRYQKNAPLIINIQDYHCHYEAQKQIAYILEDLLVNYGVKLFMVEGNSKDASLKHLRSMATRERRIEVGEDYLKRGMISGEEYLDIISEYDFKALGIEDKELYMKNLDSYLEIDTFQKDILTKLDQFRIIIQNLKPLVFNKKILEIVAKRDACEKDELKVREYGEYILALAKKNKVVLNFTYKNVLNAMKSSNMADAMDFNKISRQRDDFVQTISKKLNEEDLAQLLFKAKEYKENRINSQHFHAYLQTLPHGNWKTDYPELVEYVEYLNLYESIEPIILFDELDMIEDAVKETLFKNEHERFLSAIDRNFELFYSYISLDLIPSQYDYYKTYPERFNIREWQVFLDKMSRKYKLSKQLPQNIADINDKLPRIDNFYRLAKERDHVFTRRIKSYMEQEKADIGVLITGGFHSTQLADLIYNAGYSFMTVLPNVKQVTDDELYRSVIKYKADLLKKAEQENLEKQENQVNK